MTPKLQTHFLNLYSMALADSKFDEKEIAVLYKLGEERGVPKEMIDTMLLNPPRLQDLHFPESISEKIEYLYDYSKMILADGVVHDDEIRTLEKFCAKFRFEEKNISTIVQFLIEAARNSVSKTDLLDFVNQK